jgi:hypothetical protein
LRRGCMTRMAGLAVGVLWSVRRCRDVPRAGQRPQLPPPEQKAPTWGCRQKTDSHIHRGLATKQIHKDRQTHTQLIAHKHTLARTHAHTNASTRMHAHKRTHKGRYTNRTPQQSWQEVIHTDKHTHKHSQTHIRIHSHTLARKDMCPHTNAKPTHTHREPTRLCIQASAHNSLGDKTFTQTNTHTHTHTQTLARKRTHTHTHKALWTSEATQQS